MMGEQSTENRRRALRAFMERRGLKPTPWAKSAGVSDGAIRAFLKGDSDSLTANTYEKLAAAVDASPAELCGWVPAAEGSAHASRGAVTSIDGTVVVDGTDYTMLPVVDIQAAAGAGAINQIEPFDGMQQMFRADWVRSVTNAPPSQLVIIRVSGDSMWTTLHDGDHVLVDRSRDRILQDGIYVLDFGDGLAVKRVSRHPVTRRLSIKSDNPEYSSYDDINPDDIRVTGQVVWLGRKVLGVGP